MSEPISSGAAAGAAGAAAFKAFGGPAAIAADASGLAAFAVMMTPRSLREWAVGLISTVVFRSRQRARPSWGNVGHHAGTSNAYLVCGAPAPTGASRSAVVAAQPVAVQEVNSE